jgi:hypothetical protein
MQKLQGQGQCQECTRIQESREVRQITGGGLMRQTWGVMGSGLRLGNFGRAEGQQSHLGVFQVCPFNLKFQNKPVCLLGMQVYLRGCWRYWGGKNCSQIPFL